MFSRLALLMICCLPACATTVDTGEPETVLSYGCNDLVVVGRLLTVSEERISKADAEADANVGSFPNWNGRYQLKVRIKHVVRGSERRNVVPAIGVSHGQIRDDTDFLAVLRPAEAGAYYLEKAAVWKPPHPRLVEPCS